MKLLLQSDWQADNMTTPVKQAIVELAWKGTEVIRIYMPLWSLQQLSNSDKLKYKDYTPIGTVEFVKTFAEKVGIELPKPIFPTELYTVEGRWCREIENKDQLFQWSYDNTIVSEDYFNFPCHVKPLQEHKKFTGFVAKSDKDFDLYPEVDWENTKLFCSQVINNIVSEWRCYVLKGKVFACVNYTGDPLMFPNSRGIERMIQYFENSPAAYSLDVAICKTGGIAQSYKTTFLEVNDAWALGYYGGDVELYLKMQVERWKEIAR